MSKASRTRNSVWKVSDKHPGLRVYAWRLCVCGCVRFVTLLVLNDMFVGLH